MSKCGVACGESVVHVAPSRDGDVVRLGPAIGHAFVRQVRQRQENLLPFLVGGFGDGLQLLHPRGKLLHLRDLRQKFRRTLRQLRHVAVGRLLARARVLGLGHGGAALRIGGKNRVEVHGELLPRDGFAHAVRLFPQQLEVNHGRKTG